MIFVRLRSLEMKLNFYVPTKILMDDGCIAKNAAALRTLGKTALIVTGARSAKENGAQDALCAALTANGQAWEVFDRIKPNPDVDSVYAGAALAKSSGADFVVAIGGGSPMDAAKAIAMLACVDIPREEIFDGGCDKRLPLCCIPTTAGTGSEVTQYAILTNDAAQTKTSIASPALFPDLALLDPVYLAGLSKATMTNTVIDAFSHAVEGFLTVRANALTDSLALEAIGLIAARFPALAEGRLTAEDRACLLYASTLGGMVIAQTGTTAVHSMGYSLTYFKNVDHGRANGLLLAEFLRFTQQRHPERVAAILKAAGMHTIDEFGLALDTLLGEKETVRAEELDRYAAIAIQAKNIQNCLVPPSEAELRALYESALGLA
jgi:alcohol dehydrogenase class IV